MAVSAADGEEGMAGEDAGDDTSSAVATKPKRKVNAELDDLVGEMAGRANDEPIIIPRGAGIAPMAPGPIKADPIPGMDGESLILTGCAFSFLFFRGLRLDRSTDQPMSPGLTRTIACVVFHFVFLRSTSVFLTVVE